MFSISNQSSEEEIILNHKPNMLYIHDFKNGRYFQVVHEDEYGFEIRFAPKTMLKVLYIKEKNDIEGFEIIKLINRSESQRVRLNKFNFLQLRAFLSFIDQIDLKGITERRLKIYDEQSLDENTIRTIKTLLSKPGGAEIVETLINEGIINSKDIVNTSFRKRGLQIFIKMISKPDFWKVYAEENSLNDLKEEKIWQYFLEKNQWIFGYGLDYRFKTILQREPHVSESEIDGSNAVISDYLLGDKKFTTFVELKKPSTKLFGKSKNRSNCWKLSEELLEAVSQILEQKASGLIKFEKEQFNSAGQRITQKPYDSKVILIIGKWQELEESNTELEKEIKKKTFELFRRDSRNIDIFTFDELLERAKFIVEGNESDDDDLPF